MVNKNTGNWSVLSTKYIKGWSLYKYSDQPFQDTQTEQINYRPSLTPPDAPSASARSPVRQSGTVQMCH